MVKEIVEKDRFRQLSLSADVTFATRLIRGGYQRRRAIGAIPVNAASDSAVHTAG